MMVGLETSRQCRKSGGGRLQVEWSVGASQKWFSH